MAWGTVFIGFAYTYTIQRNIVLIHDCIWLFLYSVVEENGWVGLWLYLMLWLFGPTHVMWCVCAHACVRAKERDPGLQWEPWRSIPWILPPGSPSPLQPGLLKGNRGACICQVTQVKEHVTPALMGCRLPLLNLGQLHSGPRPSQQGGVTRRLTAGEAEKSGDRRATSAEDA